MGTGAPGTETVVGFKPPGGYWESDLGFVQEQVPVPSQPSFHSFRGLFFLMYMCMWAHMYVLMHMNVHACGGMKLASDVFSISSYFIHFI